MTYRNSIDRRSGPNSAPQIVRLMRMVSKKAVILSANDNDQALISCLGLALWLRCCSMRQTSNLDLPFNASVCPRTEAPETAEHTLYRYLSRVFSSKMAHCQSIDQMQRTPLEQGSTSQRPQACKVSRSASVPSPKSSGESAPQDWRSRLSIGPFDTGVYGLDSMHQTG